MKKTEIPDKKLFALFLPIFIETFFLMLSGIADTLMISSVGDAAVGAVGTANSYLGMFFILFAVMSNGLMAVMTQHIGQGKPGVAFQARQLAILFNAGIGVVLGLCLFFFSGPLLSSLGVAEDLKAGAETYMRIIGAGAVLDALIPVFSAYLRAFDKAKYSLIAAFSGNAVNLGLNALFLFGLRVNDPVSAVAAGTLVGKGVNIGLCLLFGAIFVKGTHFTERMPRKQLLVDIVRIGLPSALETAIYCVSMALVTIVLNRADAAGFHATARTYAQQVTNFAY